MSSVVVVGVNHKTAPLDILERLAIAEDDLVKALHQLETYEHVLEGAILSTCNRVEIYAVVSKFHGGAQDLRNFFAEFCHVAPEEFVDHLYTYHDESAVQHLFRVTAGLDSMVVGESEILGQVRRCYQAADAEGRLGRLLGTAFRQALRVGKRVRTETSMGRNSTSVSSAAVALACRTFVNDSLEGKSVAIVGAGKMGSLAGQALARSGATNISVVNRSEDRGRALADALGVEALPFENLRDVVAQADIVITSTTAPTPILDRTFVEEATLDREADLLIVDIAVPRDVEPSVGELDGVILKDIEDLSAFIGTSDDGTPDELAQIEEVISAELERFLEWEKSTEVAPTIAELVSKADEVRSAELDRAMSKLGELEPREREAVEHLSRRLVAKLLHTPIKKVKELQDPKQGYLYLAAMRELFELEDRPEGSTDIDAV